MRKEIPLERRHLLVVRLSAMGDVAIAVPVVKALRSSYPELKITVLTRGYYKPFFRDIERIDFFIPDFENRHKGPWGIVRLFFDLRAEGIDCVADLHDVIRSKLLRRLFRLFGVRVSKIDKGRGETKALTRKFQKEFVPLKPTAERFRDAVAALGFDNLTLEIPSKIKRPVPQEIATITSPKQGKWIGLAPFAKHKGKIYPPGQTDKLIGLLTAKYEKVFLFGGGRYEREFAEVMEIHHPGAVSVIGKVNLAQELDLISNLDCIVTMDSAAMHMASLMATPAVSVWGATHPYAGFYGFGQDPANAVQVELSCRPCSVYGNKPCLFGDYRCMTRITPEIIAEKVREVAGD